MNCKTHLQANRQSWTIKVHGLKKALHGGISTLKDITQHLPELIQVHGNGTSQQARVAWSVPQNCTEIKARADIFRIS